MADGVDTATGVIVSGQVRGLTNRICRYSAKAADPVSWLSWRLPWPCFVGNQVNSILFSPFIPRSMSRQAAGCVVVYTLPGQCPCDMAVGCVRAVCIVCRVCERSERVCVYRVGGEWVSVGVQRTFLSCAPPHLPRSGPERQTDKKKKKVGLAPKTNGRRWLPNPNRV